jgi:hypothetical protein
MRPKHFRRMIQVLALASLVITAVLVAAPVPGFLGPFLGWLSLIAFSTGFVALRLLAHNPGPRLDDVAQSATDSVGFGCAFFWLLYHLGPQFPVSDTIVLVVDRLVPGPVLALAGLVPGLFLLAMTEYLWAHPPGKRK